MPCPELMAQKILNIFPMVEIKKRHLKVIQLYSRKDDKNFADHQVSSNFLSNLKLRHRTVANRIKPIEIE